MQILAAVDARDIIPTGHVTDISSLLNLLLPFINIVAALGLLGMLLYGAVTWMTAADSSDSLNKAKNIFFYAIAGIVLVVSANLIVRIVAYIFNVNDQIAI